MEGNSGSLGRAWFILGISLLGTTRGEASVGLWGVGRLFRGLKYRPLLLCCEARLIAQSVMFSRLDDKESCYGRLAVVSDVDDGGFALNVDKELRGSAVL
jgi:hypothetical protein